MLFYSIIVIIMGILSLMGLSAIAESYAALGEMVIVYGTFILLWSLLDLIVLKKWDTFKKIESGEISIETLMVINAIIFLASALVVS